MSTIENVKNFYRKQEKGNIKIYPSKGEVAQIILIRHGEPDILKKKWYSRKDVLAYDSTYLQAEIKPVEHFPIFTLPVDKVYHSSLRRAAHTAELLFGDRFELIPDNRYREFERGVMKGMGINMPLKIWKIISRLQWFLGFSSSEIESVKSAMERSRSNAQHLSGLAIANKTIVLVAHGLHNRYVSRYLKKSGWSPVFDSGNGFLGTKILARELQEDSQVP
jgi:broad specificity phosphatase PhoE